MGLKEYKAYKEQEKFNKHLEEYFKKLGIKVEDLKKLSNYQEKVELTDEQKKEIKEYKLANSSPKELVEYFSQDLEEFYPNGKPNNQ